MSQLDSFVSAIDEIAKNNHGKPLDTDSARAVVSEINNFLFVSDESNTRFTKGAEDGKSEPFFSRYHEYWEANFEDLLNIEVDERQCMQVAEALHEAFVRNPADFNKINELFSIEDLADGDKWLIRFLTANQDFKKPLDYVAIAKKWKDDPGRYKIDDIRKDPSGFLHDLGLSTNSQLEKRIPFITNACDFLISKADESLWTNPQKLLDTVFQNDVLVFKNELLGWGGAGYGNKKADMLIRDMVVSGIWANAKNIDKVDVASDFNTMKIALRTGIVKTSMTLLSSFMDIFSYQYMEMDRTCAMAWRNVWELWVKKYPADRQVLCSPCKMDYFIYGCIGHNQCRDSWYKYGCPNGHIVWSKSSNLKKCSICKNGGIRSDVNRIFKGPSCVCPDAPFLGMNACPFNEICTMNGTQLLMPPSSISIEGATGWKKSHSYQNRGGGGPMA